MSMQSNTYCIVTVKSLRPAKFWSYCRDVISLITANKYHTTQIACVLHCSSVGYNFLCCLIEGIYSLV
jgi:hypothetical protein